ncbi:hypothetical protein TCCBUS3UF1_450 [Thermus sp. CCB_US3_UF1]|uniref:DUF58 domain-containing protein n=1 Tax=Thermus sp. CCB_US3_UF1 TaxID=1111069 RepID=UPI000238A1DE|nr:DUF58 domain-containing protein [Thermus sp. CCB_US3_UF1]AEV15095.1 hypothetical protein TCCBUS3UF1_450 [Thermus sp. CCB_US3_UF1]
MEGFLALLLLLALGWAPRWLRVRACLQGLPPGFPGQGGMGEVVAELFAPLPVLFRLESLPSGPLGLPAQALVGVAWGRTRLHLPLPYRYRRRGEHPVRLTLRVWSALGIGEHTLSLEAGQAVVYPSLRPLPPFRLAPSFFLEGGPAPFGLPDPLEAHSLRPYRPGDPLRLLARKASLRHGEPWVREAEKRLQGGLFLHLDTQSLHPSYPDHAASLAAWLLLEAERRGERYGLSAGEVLPLGRGRGHLERALTLLARLKPTPGPALPPPAPPGSTYLLVSQVAEEAFLEAALRGSARARQGVLLLLPEGYFLYPGERGRPAFGKTPGLERALRARALLAARGLALRVVRGYEIPALHIPPQPP